MKSEDRMGLLPSGLPELFRIHPGWQAVDVLDQTRLPEEEAWVTVRSAEEMADSIRRLHVRGAPAIGIAGALGMALELVRLARGGTSVDPDALRLARDTLVASRPTGRNLAWALGQVVDAARDDAGPDRSAPSDESTRDAGLDSPPGVPRDVPPEVRRACGAARAVWQGEAARCVAIGRHGLAVLPDSGARVLLHCNAGALATGGLGTATAPLYLAHEEGRDVRAYAGETRPVLQGARLTAWELSRVGIPVTVITDSMAGALMAAGEVDLVLVGADAVTLDGTVINKIGTYGLAVLANHHGLPFYVAVPLTTVDSGLAGADVPIEERSEEEIRRFGDRTTVPPDAGVWNPAFDRTPPHLVTAMITDGGLIRPPYGPRLRALAQVPRRPLPDP